jgi:hypothetical protein
VAEGTREMQRGIGTAVRRQVRIMEEVWRMRFADSRDKDWVICVNGPAKAQGGVDPRDSQSRIHVAVTCFRVRRMNTYIVLTFL